MTDSRQSERFVVWAAGSEHQWYSCVLAIFDDCPAALAYAREKATNELADPGDVVYVQAFIANETETDGRDIWNSKPRMLLCDDSNSADN